MPSAASTSAEPLLPALLVSLIMIAMAQPEACQQACQSPKQRARRAMPAPKPKCAAQLKQASCGAAQHQRQSSPRCLSRSSSGNSSRR